jgi:putative inorganic carbon (HCO3(-)) transporter
MVPKILKWGIYAIVFGLPLYLIGFKVIGIPTTVLELMVYALFAVWLIKGFDFLEFKKTIKENRLLFVAVFLIFLGVSLATIRSWDLRLSAGIWKAWFLDPILFFIVFISTIKSSREMKSIFYAFMLSGLVVSVISLIYLFLGKLNIDGRLQGFYDSPNYLAMYLAPALVIGLGLLAEPCSFGLRRVFLINSLRPILLILYSLFLILTLFYTGSFGAWMGIIGAIGFGLIFWFWSVKKTKIAIILAVLLIFACIGLYFVKFSSIPGRLSINSRLEIWQRAIDAVVAYPIIGIGPGTFKDFFPSYPLWGVPQPHNLYLAFLLQTGAIGFIGFVLLLIWLFGTGIKNLGLGITNIIVMALMVYMLVHGLVDTLYWKNDLSMVFWLIIGLMFVFSRPQSGSRLRSGEK